MNAARYAPHVERGWGASVDILSRHRDWAPSGFRLPYSRPCTGPKDSCGAPEPRPHNARVPPPLSDWWEWERSGRAPSSGDGNGFGTRYAEDFRLLAHWASPITDCRSSGPVSNQSRATTTSRRTPLSRCAHGRGRRRHGALGLAAPLHPSPLVPRAGGFLVEANRTEAWRRHVEFVAETFGDLVGGWQPINEDQLLRPCRLRRTRLASRT